MIAERASSKNFPFDSLVPRLKHSLILTCLSKDLALRQASRGYEYRSSGRPGPGASTGRHHLRSGQTSTYLGMNSVHFITTTQERLLV
jgi:hypothetical protein